MRDARAAPRLVRKSRAAGYAKSNQTNLEVTVISSKVWTVLTGRRARR